MSLLSGPLVDNIAGPPPATVTVNGGMPPGTTSIPVAVPVPNVGVGVQTLVADMGAATLLVYMTGRPEDAVPFAEQFDSFEDACGIVNDQLVGKYSVPTKLKGAIDQGFTEKWIGQRSSDGEWFSAFRNPTTGKWSGGKTSSHQ